MEKETVYFLIRKNQLGKRADDNNYYLFINGEWKKDEEWLILGMLGGYDASEPEGSPYGWGSTSIMDEIEKISKEEAEKIMKGI